MTVYPRNPTYSAHTALPQRYAKCFETTAVETIAFLGMHVFLLLFNSSK